MIRSVAKLSPDEIWSKRTFVQGLTFVLNETLEEIWQKKTRLIKSLGLTAYLQSCITRDSTLKES